MPGGLSEPMEPRFRVRHLRLLGTLTVVLALASCGGDSTQESTSTAASSTTTTPSSTTSTPSSTTTTPSSTTSTPASTTTVPSDPTEAAADFDIRVDADTEWGEVFDALTASEQECIRDAFDGSTLESVLERSVISESGTPAAWEILIFSCLAPEVAQAVFLSSMVAGMEEDGAFGIDADGEACLAEWVAGLDVVATMAALSVGNAEAEEEVATSFMTCNPDMFVSLMLNLFDSLMFEETGLTLEDLSEEEASCLREWVTGADWTTHITAAADGFIPDLLVCAPDLFLSSMLEETGLTLEDLSEEEASCLRAWVADADWTPLLPGATHDPYSLFFDFFPALHDCIPDPSWSEADDRPQDEVIEEAAPVELGIATQGELEYDQDSDFFRFEATEGEYYELDVTLGTLQDSVLDLYDAEGQRLASNDDYGDSTASRLTWHAPSTGTYHVRVTNFNAGTGTYTLTTTVSDIEGDHPNSTNNVTPVEIGAATQGELDFEGDLDIFRFEATEGEYYVIDVTLGTLQDSVLHLYDADRNWMTSNDDYGDSRASRLIWLAPSTGTYHVHVHSYATGTGTYTLTIAPS